MLFRDRLAILVIVGLALAIILELPVYAQKGGDASPAQAQAGGQAAGGGSTPFFETQMLAYGGVNQLSQTVAEEVYRNFKDVNKPTVIIFDQSSFQNLQAWQSFVSSVRALQEAYGTLLEPVVAAQLLAPEHHGGPGLGFFPITGGADLAALITALASSTTNTASAFTIQDSTMAVSLAHQFYRTKSCSKINLIYYPLFGAYVNPSDAGKKLTDAMSSLNKMRNYIQLNTAFSSNNDPQFLLFTDLNNQYDQLLKAILSAPGSGQGQGGQAGGGSSNSGGNPSQPSGTAGPSPGAGGSQGYTSLIQGAELNDLLNQYDTYILYADVVAAGGTQRDRKNILTLVTGDWISYSGGLIVNVALIDGKDTSLVFADTLRYRSGNEHISKPRESVEIENTNAGENEASVCGHETRLHWWQGEKHTLNPCASLPPVAQTQQPGSNLSRPSLLTVKVTPEQLGGGGSAKLIIQLRNPAPEVGAEVQLSSNDPSVTIASPIVKIPKDGKEGQSDVHTSSVSVQTEVTINAHYLNATDATYSADGFEYLKVNPPLWVPRTALVTGMSGTVQITLQDVSAQPRAVTLSVDDPALSLDVPTIMIGADNNTGSSHFTARKVAAVTLATITATLDGRAIGSVTVTVNPSAPPK